jgi:hypothetical protein
LGEIRVQAAVVGDDRADSQRQQQQGAGAVGAVVAAAAAGGTALLTPSQQVQQQQQRQQQQQAAGNLVQEPEDFQLAPGELSYVARGKPLSAVDVFRCAACTRPECQASLPILCRSLVGLLGT